MVTAEVTPHHLLLTDELARSYDPRYKVNPPLRRDEDVMALRQGLADGTIDAVATDHAPHPVEDKECEWSSAAFGMIGLQSALSVVQTAMIETGLMTWSEVSDRMSTRPARIGSLRDHGRPIAVGEPAQVVLLDPRGKSPFTLENNASLSTNSPFIGMELYGRVEATFLRGRATVLDGKLAG